MGYTHYWRQHRDFNDTEWRVITRLAKLITADGLGVLAHHPDAMNGDEYYGGKEDDIFIIDNEQIRFNGIGEDGHETFLITKKKPEENFQFCKTAHKPYDKYVVAVLCAIYHVYLQMEKTVMNISSDGNTKDWTEGLFHAVRSTRVEEMYCPIRDCLTLSYVDYIDREKKTG